MEEQKATHLAIEVEVINQLVSYLQSKPYVEVSRLIDVIIKSKAININEDEKAE